MPAPRGLEPIDDECRDFLPSYDVVAPPLRSRDKRFMPPPPSSQALVQSRYETPLGWVCLLASPRGLAGLWFDDQKHRPSELDGLWPLEPSNRWLVKARQQLEAYFERRRRDFDLPLDLSAGTAFQQAVWTALMGVPHGQTRSYGQIADSLGRPQSARAVGMAVGLNRLSIIVPCHRIVGSQGALTGYAGGLDRKRELLLLERFA